MKVTSHFSTLASVAFLVLLFSMSENDRGAKADREWVSNSGSKMRAKLISYSDKKATLLVAPNRRIVVNIDKLSPGDQAYLEAWVPTGGEHWETVPSIAQGFRGNQGGVPIQMGDKLVIFPLADRPIRLVQGGKLKEPLIFSITAPDVTITDLTLIIFGVLPFDGGVMRTINRFPLKAGQKEFTIDSATESNTRISGGGLQTGDLYIYLIDGPEECLSNIVHLKCQLP